MIIELLSDIITERALSFLYISHNLNIITRLVNFVYVMFAGQIVESGPIDVVIQKSSDQQSIKNHPYTKTLLDSLMQKKLNNSDKYKKKNGGIIYEKNYAGCRYYYRCPLLEKATEKERERCLNERPTLSSAETPKHKIACWLVR